MRSKKEDMMREIAKKWEELVNKKKQEEPNSFAIISGNEHYAIYEEDTYYTKCKNCSGYLVMYNETADVYEYSYDGERDSCGITWEHSIFVICDYDGQNIGISKKIAECYRKGNIIDTNLIDEALNFSFAIYEYSKGKYPEGYYPWNHTNIESKLLVGNVVNDNNLENYNGLNLIEIKKEVENNQYRGRYDIKPYFCVSRDADFIKHASAESKRICSSIVGIGKMKKVGKNSYIDLLSSGKIEKKNIEKHNSSRKEPITPTSFAIFKCKEALPHAEKFGYSQCMEYGEYNIVFGDNGDFYYDEENSIFAICEHDDKNTGMSKKINELYQKKGINSVLRMKDIGMFNFALFDLKKNDLFVGRHGLNLNYLMENVCSTNPSVVCISGDVDFIRYLKVTLKMDLVEKEIERNNSYMEIIKSSKFFIIVNDYKPYTHERENSFVFSNPSINIYEYKYDMCLKWGDYNVAFNENGDFYYDSENQIIVVCDHDKYGVKWKNVSKLIYDYYTKKPFWRIFNNSDIGDTYFTLLDLKNNVIIAGQTTGLRYRSDIFYPGIKYIVNDKNGYRIFITRDEYVISKLPMLSPIQYLPFNTYIYLELDKKQVIDEKSNRDTMLEIGYIHEERYGAKLKSGTLPLDFISDEWQQKDWKEKSLDYTGRKKR